MSASNEQQLFKLCVEQPMKLSKDLNSLNIQFVSDPKRQTLDHDEPPATADAALMASKHEDSLEVK